MLLYHWCHIQHLKVAFFHAHTEVVMSSHRRCLYLLEFTLCANCPELFLKKHGTVLTCSYPLPVNFSCVYFINFPLWDPWKFVKSGYLSELGTPVNSAGMMAPHSRTLAWRIPWTGEPGRLQSMGSLRVVEDWATSPSLFTFMHWRREWQPTPVFLPGESQGQGSLVGCHLWGRTESDTTEATQQQQQQQQQQQAV